MESKGFFLSESKTNKWLKQAIFSETTTHSKTNLQWFGYF